VSSTQVQGAQVVSRIAALLRFVGRRAEGTSLSEVVRDTGLTRPTAHRLLTALTVEGLLDHQPTTKTWSLGPEFHVMASVAAAQFPIGDIVRPSLHRLAEKTEESAFFSLRRGNRTVCLMREEGSFPIRTFTLLEGTRYPLGVASAGIAIMAFLSREEQDELFTEGEWRAEKFGQAHTAEAIRPRLERARARGFSVNPGLILEGSWGMGAAVFDRNKNPVYALSLTGIESRFRGERQEFLGKALLSEAHRLTLQLQRPWA
jgi:DNA-binding IclR family transcriptional regulator